MSVAAVDTIERPVSCPAPGVIPAFDAGCAAHVAGLDRDTVRLLSPDKNSLGGALMAYNVRARVAAEVAAA